MNRSPAHATPYETAARWLRVALDSTDTQHDSWKTSALANLELRALSYAARWISGEQHVPLAAVIATAKDHPQVAEHVARNLAALVGKVLADTPRVTDVLNDVHAFATLGASSGKVLDVVGRAIEDGVITPGERAAMIAALEALAERTQSLLVRLRGTQREGVEGVRLAKVAR